MKHCALESCNIELPPQKARVVLTIRRLPGVLNPKFYAEIFFGDVNQEVFCSDDHMFQWLKELSEKVPSK